MSAVRRIVQVSDLHLGASGGIERQQAADTAWSEFAARMGEDPPELVVVTGDVVVDDPDSVDDHRHARDLLDGLAVPTMVLPGNHDVGDHEVRDGLPADWHGSTVSAERVRRWESIWGASWRRLALGEWSVIGLNSQLFGSGLGAEREQWRWLEEEALPASDGGRTLVFMHEALHLRPEYGQGAPENGWMAIPRAESERLALVLAGQGVELLGSGHTHRFAEWRAGGFRQISAPSLVGPIPVRSSMAQPQGAPEPGWIELVLSGDEVRARPRRGGEPVPAAASAARSGR